MRYFLVCGFTAKELGFVPTTTVAVLFLAPSIIVTLPLASFAT